MRKCKDEYCLKMVANPHYVGRSGYCNTHSVENGFRSHSQQFKELASLRMRGNKYALGIRYKKQPFSEEHRRNMSIARIGKYTGINSPSWKGGITPIYRKIRSSTEYAAWRKSVFTRDNYTCQECGARNGNGKTIVLEADHIKPFALYPKLRFELSNGRTLCRPCHFKTSTHGRFKKSILINNTKLCV